jgi:hypothetical protein
VRVGQRLFLAVVPAVIGVLSVAALAFWGEYQRQAPRAIVVIAALAAVSSLFVAWRNTRYVAMRIERLVSATGSGRARVAPSDDASAPPAPVATQPDELDSIEHVVDNLSSAVALATDEGRRRERAADERVREYAALLAETSAAVARQLEEVRLPLHILLDSHFGDLNENQEEMIGAARAAADAADLELGRLREIADIDRGALSLRRDLIRPGELIESLLPTLRAEAQREGVRISTDVAPALPRIAGDRGRLQEALSLLLSERIRLAPAGNDVRISVEADHSQLRIAIDHSASPRVSAEEGLARRLVAAHQGTVREQTGRTTITLPTR